jgi:RimJ/RimL family protein N-acetyltransferase
VLLDLTGIDLTTEVVRTERLVLRPFRPEDAEAVFAGCQAEDIRGWMAAIPSPYTREDARQFVTELAPGERAAGRGMPVAVEAGGVLVGASGLHFWPGRLGPEIGYWIAPEARGNGYAAETAHALAEWAFGLGAPRVHLWVDVDNAPSQAVARRAGFTQEGVVRAVLDRRDGSRADAVLFGRLPTD